MAPCAEISMLAARDALYQRLLDVYWEEFKEIFQDPEVREAEMALARAIAKRMSPRVNGNGRPPRRKR